MNNAISRVKREQSMSCIFYPDSGSVVPILALGFACGVEPICQS